MPSSTSRAGFTIFRGPPNECRDASGWLGAVVVAVAVGVVVAVVRQNNKNTNESNDMKAEPLNNEEIEEYKRQFNLDPAGYAVELALIATIDQMRKVNDAMSNQWGQAREEIRKYRTLAHDIAMDAAKWEMQANGHLAHCEYHFRRLCEARKLIERIGTVDVNYTDIIDRAAKWTANRDELLGPCPIHTK